MPNTCWRATTAGAGAQAAPLKAECFIMNDIRASDSLMGMEIQAPIFSVV